MRIFRITFLLACLHPLLFAAPLNAHPHAWIALQSRAIFDDEKRVVAVQVDWLFDEFYTLYLRDALPSSPDEVQAALDRLAETNLENLRDFDYFVEIRADGAAIAVRTVTDYETALREGRLWMRFTAPLETSVDPREKTLTYASYDPTYFIEILHADQNGVGVAGPGSEGCDTRIVAPNPSLETIALAAAIDGDEEASPTLGRLFAERVVVRCP